MQSVWEGDLLFVWCVYGYCFHLLSASSSRTEKVKRIWKSGEWVSESPTDLFSSASDWHQASFVCGVVWSVIKMNKYVTNGQTWGRRVIAGRCGWSRGWETQRQELNWEETWAFQSKAGNSTCTVWEMLQSKRLKLDIFLNIKRKDPVKNHFDIRHKQNFSSRT